MRVLLRQLQIALEQGFKCAVISVLLNEPVVSTLNSVNPYVGCPHACRYYYYASFMKRFANHPEPWGEFLDVKHWPEIRNAQRYWSKEMFIGSVTDSYNSQEKTYGRTRALLIQLQDSGDRLTMHLRMTGQLLVMPAEEPVEKHTHLILRLSDGQHLRYIDVRRFGRFWLFAKDEADTLTGQAMLGLEPTDPAL